MKYQMNFTTSYDDVIRFTLLRRAGAYAPAILYGGSSRYLSAAEKVPADCTGDGDRNPLLLCRGLGEPGQEGADPALPEGFGLCHACRRGVCGLSCGAGG